MSKAERIEELEEKVGKLEATVEFLWKEIKNARRSVFSGPYIPSRYAKQSGMSLPEAVEINRS